MLQSYKKTSAVLSKKEMSDLGWQQFIGTVEEYRSYRGKLVDKDGKVYEKFKGSEGYALFSESQEDGKMSQAYQKSSAVLSKKEMGDLCWKTFLGSVEDYRSYREKLIDKDGKFKGSEGYALFSESQEDGKMLRAYQKSSAVLSKEEMGDLSWQAFNGSVEDFKVYRALLYNNTNEIDYLRWQGKKKGLNEIVEAYLFSIGSDLPFKITVVRKVRTNFRASVSKEEKEKLGWDKVSSCIKNMKSFD